MGFYVPNTYLVNKQNVHLYKLLNFELDKYNFLIVGNLLHYMFYTSILIFRFSLLLDFKRYIIY